MMRYDEICLDMTLIEQKAEVKQLKQLKVEVQAAQEKQRQLNGPLGKELAKLVISLRGGPEIS